MHTTSTAVIFEKPGQLLVDQVDIREPEQGECVVALEWSGISTGTERLLWQGRMPTFPGMGYPLVPGYESVGVVDVAGSSSMFRKGQRVFVPGASCYTKVHALFGGASSRLVVPETRLVLLADDIESEGVLIALAATAMHALRVTGELALPELIIGHGVLGRLLARMVIALGGTPPVVWEKDLTRSETDLPYQVVEAAEDARKDYRLICDVSGDSSILDTLISRLCKGGQLVLAGFYDKPLSFTYPPAFMREARIQIAAEWNESDLQALTELMNKNLLSFEGLLTHHEQVENAADAYATAFENPECLKMVLDWRHIQ